MTDDRLPLNGLLAALRGDDWQAIRPSLTMKDLARGDLLHEADAPFSAIHFPLFGIISSVASMANGLTAELATVGREGMAEVGAILGSQSALFRHVVQIPGQALVLSYDVFRRFMQERPTFLSVLQAYAQAHLVQVSQSVACNAVHPPQARAARWLLTCHDRNGGRAFTLTQEFFAEMLGVSRVVVSRIAQALQRGGMIRYARGTVTVVNREALEATACECYGVIRSMFVQRGLRVD